jgi:hypothetical protein
MGNYKTEKHKSKHSIEEKASIHAHQATVSARVVYVPLVMKNVAK